MKNKIIKKIMQSKRTKKIIKIRILIMIIKKLKKQLQLKNKNKKIFILKTFFLRYEWLLLLYKYKEPIKIYILDIK